MAYRLSALAEQDLEEIWSYVAEDASPVDRLSTHRRHLRSIRVARRTACAWDANDPSSAKAFARSSLRAMSSTIGATQTSSSPGFSTVAVITPLHGPNERKWLVVTSYAPTGNLSTQPSSVF